jgi:hypothetical protein
MRAYIALDTLPEPGQLLPPGTKATTEPREALHEAQRAGKPWILLFCSSASAPLLSAGRTTRELDPCKPSRFYPTERATVAPYPGRCGPYRERLRTV